VLGTRKAKASKEKGIVTSFDEVRRFSAEEIARIYGIPPHWLAHADVMARYGYTDADLDFNEPEYETNYYGSSRMTDAQRNPEQDVLDDIDEALNAGEHWDHGERGAPKCPVCDSDWHGLTGTGDTGKLGCPGEFGTDDEKEDWIRDYEARKAARLEQQRRHLADGGQNPKVPNYLGGAGGGVSESVYSSGGAGGGRGYTLADVAEMMTNGPIRVPLINGDPGPADLDGPPWVDLGYIDET
jgi:hypothetical protein